MHFKISKKRSKNICLNFICLSKKDASKKKLFIKNLNLMSHIVDDQNNLYFKDYPVERINLLAKEANLENFKSYECKIEILENIFDKFNINSIDLAIIDVEGSELELLKRY